MELSFKSVKIGLNMAVLQPGSRSFRHSILILHPRYYSGHNIVPGTIPPGTLIYHGTWHKELLVGPEWAALDPEHSIHFCGNGAAEIACWHVTLMTKRPLKILYFDGSSAAKTPLGTMDTQDLVA